MMGQKDGLKALGVIWRVSVGKLGQPGLDTVKREEGMRCPGCSNWISGCPSARQWDLGGPVPSGGGLCVGV